MSIASVLLLLPRGPKCRDEDLSAGFAARLAALGTFRTETLVLAVVVGAVASGLIAFRAIVHLWSYPLTPRGGLYALSHIVGGAVGGTLVGLAFLSTSLCWTIYGWFLRMVHATVLASLGFTLGHLVPLVVAGLLTASTALVEINPAAPIWRPSWLSPTAAYLEPLKDSLYYLAEVLVVAGTWATQRVLGQKRQLFARWLAVGVFTVSTLIVLRNFRWGFPTYWAPGTPGSSTRFCWTTTQGLLMIGLLVLSTMIIWRSRLTTVDRSTMVAPPLQCPDWAATWCVRWQAEGRLEESFFTARVDATTWCEHRWITERKGMGIVHRRAGDRWTPVEQLQSDDECGFFWEDVEGHE